MKIKKKTSNQQDVTFLVQKNEQDCATTTKVAQLMLCTFYSTQLHRHAFHLDVSISQVFGIYQTSWSEQKALDIYYHSGKEKVRSACMFKGMIQSPVL